MSYLERGKYLNYSIIVFFANISPKNEWVNPLTRAVASWDKPFFSLIDRIFLPRLTRTGLPEWDGDGFAIPKILNT